MTSQRRARHKKLPDSVREPGTRSARSCGGVLDEELDLAIWKARYLEMCDDQIDGHALNEDYKQQRRAVIEATFDKLIGQHKEQWQRDEVGGEQLPPFGECPRRATRSRCAITL